MSGVWTWVRGVTCKVEHCKHTAFYLAFYAHIETEMLTLVQ